MNLTLGPPVAPAKRVASLVDAEGTFIRDAREAAQRARPDEARIELGMQIDEFRKIMGRFPTHLDSHHHVGRHEPILELVLDFARAIKVPVRTPGRGGARGGAEARAQDAGPLHGRVGSRTPTGRRERVLAHLRELPAGVTEFMTHPGYFDDDLAYSRYGRQRDTELAGLTDPEARALVEREGIRLIHFGNL